MRLFVTAYSFLLSTATTLVTSTTSSFVSSTTLTTTRTQHHHYLPSSSTSTSIKSTILVSSSSKKNEKEISATTIGKKRSKISLGKNTKNNNTTDQKISTCLATSRGGGAASASASSATQEKKRSLSSWELAGAGALATMVGDLTMHPIDCIKTLQQSTEGRGLSMLGASQKILSDYGPGGFLSGAGTYVVSDGMAGAVKFASYEAMKSWVNERVPEKYQGSALFGIAALAFIASSVVLVPGELIKQRLQMGQITSVADGITQIWNTDGPLGFYRGYAGVCFRDVPYTMMELGIYDNIKRLYLNFKRSKSSSDDAADDAKITQMDELFAAAIAGGITGFLTNPLDTFKTKLMVNPELYSGFFDCVRQNIAQDGMGALFAGAAARVSWIMPFTAIYLPLYESMKRKLETLPKGSSKSTIISAFVPAFGMSTTSTNKNTLLAMKGGSADTDTATATATATANSDETSFTSTNHIIYPTPTISEAIETTDSAMIQQKTNQKKMKTYRLDGNDSFVKNAVYMNKGTSKRREMKSMKGTKKENKGN